MSTNTLLVLGDFKFEVFKCPLLQIGVQNGYTWGEQPSLGGAPKWHFMGLEAETWDLSGIAYPELSGPEPLAKLREEAKKGKPLRLIDGLGKNLGKWLIKSISENIDSLDQKGT